jgi:quercetin dioxygenase-like cupin family protein
MNKSIWLAVLASAALADAPKPPSTEEALVADPAEAKFAPVTVPGIPAGAQGAMIGVDPSTRGATTYTKLPAKYHLPAHWHSFAEYSVLVSGSATFTLDGKPHELVPGSYVVIPARTKHELDCGAAGECLLLTRRAGPTDYNFIK